MHEDKEGVGIEMILGIDVGLRMGLRLELWVGLKLRMVTSGFRKEYGGVFHVRKGFRLGLGWEWVAVGLEL